MISPDDSPKQVRYSFPAARVYIFGANVSEDVMNLSISYSDQRTPSHATITITSPDDKYVITNSDIGAMYDDDENIKTLEQAESRIEAQLTGVKGAVVKAKYKVRSLNQNQRSYSDIVLDVIGADSKARTEFQKSAKPSIDPGLAGDFLYYPYQTGHCIFHTGDPVTIFVRNPFNPDEWHWGLRGVVSDWQTARDANGGRQITIKVEGNLRMLRLSRVAFNWAFHDVDAVRDPKYDNLLRTWYADGFRDLTLPEYFRIILFGLTDLTPDMQLALKRSASTGDPRNNTALELVRGDAYRGVKGEVPFDLNITGAGAFNRTDSLVRVLDDRPLKTVKPDAKFVKPGPGGDKEQDEASSAGWALTPISSLEEWQSIVDSKLPTTVKEGLALLEVLSKDIFNLPLKYAGDQFAVKGVGGNQRNSDGEDILNTYAFMDEIGEHPEYYPPTRGRLLMLLPKSMAPGLNRDVLHEDLIGGIASTTQFTTRLQLLYNICERLQLSLYDNARGDIVVEMPLYHTEPRDYGKYKERFEFTLDDIIQEDTHFTDENVKTKIISNFNTVEQNPGLGNNDAVGTPPSTVTLDALIPAFGVRVDYAPTFGKIASGPVAAYNALLYMTRVNAQAWKANMQVVMRAGLQPNRPCWFESSEFIAMTRSTGFSIRWGKSGSVTQSLTLDTRRGWSGMTETIDDQVVKYYESYGGRASNPIDYSLLFSDRDLPNTQGGGRRPPGRRVNQSLVSDAATAQFKGKKFPPGGADWKELVKTSFSKWNADNGFKPGDRGYLDPALAENPDFTLIFAGAKGVPGENPQGIPGLPNYQYAHSDLGRGYASDEGIAAIRQAIIDGKDPWLGQTKVLGANRSSATGLGQLILANVDAYYPNGREGVGDPYNEIVGAGRYMMDRYGAGGLNTPAQAAAAAAQKKRDTKVW